MVESDVYRSAMARLGAAVSIVTTDGPAGRYGITASAVCSVTDTPPTLLICVNRASSANRYFKKNGVLCVNVLAGRHQALSQRFSRPCETMAERFGDDREWKALATGSAALADASVALDCRVAAVEEVGTHSVFFCEIADVLFHEEAEGLIYFNRAYHSVATA